MKSPRIPETWRSHLAECLIGSKGLYTRKIDLQGKNRRTLDSGEVFVGGW